MTYYAKLLDTRIQVVVQSDNPGEGRWTAIGGPVNWADRPTSHHQPHLINGAVVWVDRRSAPGAASEKWKEVCAKRDAILRASDWRPVFAADRGGQAMAQWAQSPWRDYRQALRDITNQADPFSIVWPAPPP